MLKCLTKVLRGHLRGFKGFVSMFQSLVVFVSFAISCIGVSFIQLFSSGLEVMGLKAS